MARKMTYAELHVLSNFTFLEGASHPEDYVERAAELGLEAVAITDRNTLAGVVRAHAAAKKAGIRTIIGAQFDLVDGQRIVALPQDRAAYGRLSRLISLGRRRVEKGSCELHVQDVKDGGAGNIFIIIPPDEPDALDDGFAAQLKDWQAAFKGRIYLALAHMYRGDDTARMARIATLGDAVKMPLVATNHAQMHVPARRVLADVLTCIREKCTIEEAGRRVLKNAERHLKSADEMTTLLADYPDAIARTIEIINRISFTLDDLRYEYPDEVANGRDPQEELECLVKEGQEQRYPYGVPETAAKLVTHELRIIKDLNYASYFLTVHDIVRFARSQNILAQGRGSAANSIICYMLGITSVSPDRMDMVFERFISAQRNEPPDIDVDFEHERREEIIQYIYKKYGRERAGLAATVICYRARSAIREVGKALGLSVDTVSLLASQVWGWSDTGLQEKRVREVGLDPTDPRLDMCLSLARELIGFPRHLSQHVGGFIITRSRLDEVVPIENAAMEDRTVIEWDKDDLDTLGILKMDVLGLGMLSCIRKAFELLKVHYGVEHDLASLPEDDEAVYDMLCEADSLGVFQVESRAQMSFLPRMRPRNFYDLVIEVAIVRPGPIQGDMVHPYLRRRNGEEDALYPSEELRDVLGKTLGVPLFQEQAMRIAIVGAGFSPEEADQLRRAMATFRKTGTIQNFREKFIQGMIARDYEQEFAARCFSQIEGFGEYGFPESHAASFALLVYVSAWIKCHYPAVFACAIINSQPMGFYAPAQLVRDAREHAVEVRAPDVNFSDWDCTLEPGENGMAVRLGLRQIKGLKQEDGDWIASARGNGYATPKDIWRRAGVRPNVLKVLARADAYQSMNVGRREALWDLSSLRGDKPLPLFDHAGEADMGEEEPAILPPMTLGEDVVQDYVSMRLSLKAHPMQLLRGYRPRDTLSGDLVEARNGAWTQVAGLVLVRQRPGSAKGVIFLTLEDETGTSNIVVWRKTFERYRRVIMTARLIGISGQLQREGIVTHIIARKVENLSHLLDRLDSDEPLKPALAHADEINKPSRPDPRSAPQRKPTQAVPQITAQPIARPRHPREQAKALFPSRDFH